METHQVNLEHKDGIWALIEVDVSKLSSRTRRVNITVPERVLAIVDKMAAREGETRSGLLARAALSYAERQSHSVTIDQSPGRHHVCTVSPAENPFLAIWDRTPGT